MKVAADGREFVAEAFDQIAASAMITYIAARWQRRSGAGKISIGDGLLDATEKFITG